MELKQSCNVFLAGDQYRALKELGYEQDRPYSEIIREGINLVLQKYARKKDRVEAQNVT